MVEIILPNGMVIKGKDKQEVENVCQIPQIASAINAASTVQQVPVQQIAPQTVQSNSMVDAMMSFAQPMMCMGMAKSMMSAFK